METENVFRFVLLAGVAVLLPVAMYHRLRAHLSTREKLNRRAEGLFILFTLRPVALVSIAGLLRFLRSRRFAGPTLPEAFGHADAIFHGIAERAVETRRILVGHPDLQVELGTARGRKVVFNTFHEGPTDALPPMRPRR